MTSKTCGDRLAGLLGEEREDAVRAVRVCHLVAGPTQIDRLFPRCHAGCAVHTRGFWKGSTRNPQRQTLT